MNARKQSACLIAGIVLTACGGMACAAQPSVKQQVKYDAKTAGHDIGSGARDVGHATRNAAVSIGHGARDAGHGIADGARQGWDAIRQAVQRMFH